MAFASAPTDAPTDSPLGRHLAGLLERLHGVPAPDIAAAVRTLCWEQAAGHVCLDLRMEEGPSDPGAGPPAESRVAWRRELERSPVAGAPGERRPLILDAEGRLYLYRYWAMESDLARCLRQRARQKSDFKLASLADGLERLFPAATAPESPDRQRLAAALALLRPLCVISGGPGTGKTATVARLLALWLEQCSPGASRFALVAPTGRAAARLGQMVAREAERLKLDPVLHDPPVRTLHRLLGARRDGQGFRYNSRRPLALDLLVVDEASMMDLELAAALLRALPLAAHLVLLGDKDQLASVEAGAVLAELCDQAEGYSPGLARDLGSLCPGVLPSAPRPGFGDSVVLLRRNHRFTPNSGIARLAEAVRAGDAQSARELLDTGCDRTLRFQDLSKQGTLQECLERVLPGWLNPYLEALEVDDPEAALAALQKYRLLATVREGPYGVSGLTHKVEAWLRGHGQGPARVPPFDPWYPGRPVLLTRNHHERRLYNGDLGLTLRKPGAGASLYFASPAGSPRRLSPKVIPPHQTAFALTAHRAQGSESDCVCLLLPPPGHAQLTRELLYTGITRARQSLEIWGSGVSLEQAVARPARRNSGLGAMLRATEDPPVP